MSYFGKMSQCNTTFDFKINLGHTIIVTYISRSSGFSSFIFCPEKYFKFNGKV